MFHPGHPKHFASIEPCILRVHNSDAAQDYAVLERFLGQRCIVGRVVGVCGFDDEPTQIRFGSGLKLFILVLDLEPASRAPL